MRHVLSTEPSKKEVRNERTPIIEMYESGEPITIMSQQRWSCIASPTYSVQQYNNHSGIGRTPCFYFFLPIIIVHSQPPASIT